MPQWLNWAFPSLSNYSLLHESNRRLVFNSLPTISESDFFDVFLFID